MNDPFTRILVSLDGSNLAEVSLPVAEAFARRNEHEITLLHVLEPDAPATVHGDKHLQSEAEAIAYLEEKARILRQHGVRVSVLLEAAGSLGVASLIAASANELGIELVVLATHGRGGLRNILFGRVAQNVLKFMTRPLVIVPANGGATSFTCKSMVVPLDGGDESETVLPYASFLTRFFDARTVLVRVVPTPGTLQGAEAAVGMLLPGSTAKMLQYEDSEADKYLQEIVIKWFASQDAAIDVRRGQVETEIVEALQQHQADLAVMSTHARTGLEAFLEGSIGQRLFERPVCPVLLIRASG